MMSLPSGSSRRIRISSPSPIHDVITQWPFTKDPDKEPFTKGTDKMEKEDFQKGLTMLYEKFGWDSEKGCPTADCLDYYGMDDVKAELQSLNLLP